MDQIKLEYSEDLMRRAVKSFLKKKIGVFFPLFILVVTIGILYFAVNGVRTWQIGMLATLDGLVILTTGLLYIIHLKVALKRFSLLENKPVLLSMDDEKFHFSSAIGTSHLKWDLIKKIWCFEDYMLIFYSLSEFNTIPTRHMTEEHITHFITRAKEHGAKVD